MSKRTQSSMRLQTVQLLVSVGDVRPNCAHVIYGAAAFGRLIASCVLPHENKQARFGLPEVLTTLRRRMSDGPHSP